MNNGSILSVRNLHYGYGSVEVLADVTFDVEKGDYIGLAGPNGAGKTTLVKAVLGLLEKFRGTIKLFGQDLKSFDRWGRIGYLSQRVTAFNPLFPASVKEVVGLGLLSKKKFPKRFGRTDDVRIRQSLDLMGISDLEDRPVSDLSGGQQQRVFLARALVSDPEILILDEPGTALDPQSRVGFFEFIKQLNQNKGITILLITHDTAQIGQYANKLLYLDKKVVFYGSFADFCRSDEMHLYFGHFSQHLICHQHD
ncbi:MAG TPA: metal ABC transporter ATP-binding protein [Thermodesulfovibrionales bacterium]|nr:metal ABC transporter ATP-binding protein [Thermodesulfovibrionales bacterium]